MANPRGNPNGNPYGTRWRGKLAIPKNSHPLVRDLFEEMNRQKVSMCEAARRAGMIYQTVSTWRYNRNPCLPNFVALANTLGLDVKLVRRRGEGE